jgi:maltooligosyltrehalose trehalohydrolase
MRWRPSLGAIPEAGGTRFRVLAPRASALEVRIERAGAIERTKMTPDGRGYHEAFVPGARPGDRYRIALDGQPFPDPASRFQPDGVHSASQIADPVMFRWTDAGWHGVPLARLVLYEVHVGTFTPEGTFAALAARLLALAELGATAIELMPVADFPGHRNWGYDGGALFAPARCYGTPDDLRRLIDRAHGLGLAMHLDVVYNHFGPDGAYAAAFNPDFFSTQHQSPWGAGINLDGPRSDLAREYFIENACHWIHEYHFDGLRLDATHAMVDESPRHFLAELADRVRGTVGGREVQLIAEDARNWAHMVRPESDRGWGLDAVWSDDFHHVTRRLLAGDDEGYFRDFAGTTEELAAALRAGWLFTGQRSAYAGRPRGTVPDGIPPARFVIFNQNHDQVGNRAFGERLHHQIEPAAYRAASTLLLMAPQTPLLFMGQEWAASTPFRFFTDHAEPLGAQVTAGRRLEFERFPSFSDPAVRQRIPDPQSARAFEDSRLDWNEREREGHAEVLRLFQALLALRHTHAALAGGEGASHDAQALDADTIRLVRRSAEGATLEVVVRLRGAGAVTLSDLPRPPSADEVVFTTEAAAFVDEPRPPVWSAAPGGAGVSLEFARPGAVAFERTP